MSEEGAAAAVAPAAGSPVVGSEPSTPAAAPVAAAPAATPIIGQEPAAPAPTGDINPYEAKYGSFLDPEGNFTDGTREYLEKMGIDQGRIERMTRQGSIDNVFKALDHAQGLVEKRDGNRDYIPDPSDENAFNRWRDEKGIPRDPSDAQGGYNFKAGLPEGADSLIDGDTLNEVGKLLHGLNAPKEQADALIEKVNAALSQGTESMQEKFALEQQTREQNVYNEFKAKHGFEFDKANEAVGRINQAYGLNPDDPIDRVVLTHPKYLEMAVDLAGLSRTTAPMPEGGASEGGSAGSPQTQIETIMREHPNGAWKRDTVLASRVSALAKQATAMQKRR